MKILVVFSHPIRRSFTGDVMDYCGVTDVGFEVLHKARYSAELTEEAKAIREEHLQTAYRLGREYFSP